MAALHRIVPHLWFDKEASEAARFYASVFPDSRLRHEGVLHEVPTPTGDCDIVSFDVLGQPFMPAGVRFGLARRRR